MQLVASLLASGAVELAVNGTQWLSSEVAAVRVGSAWAANACEAAIGVQEHVEYVCWEIATEAGKARASELESASEKEPRE